MPWTANQADETITRISDRGQQIVQGGQRVTSLAKRGYKRISDYMSQPTSSPKSKKSMPYVRRKYGSRVRSTRGRGKSRTRSARATVQRRRVKARRYGNYRAAKRLRLPIGGFTQRKVVKLRDNFAFNVTGSVGGQNACYQFCLSDLRDPQLCGQLKATSATAGPQTLPLGTKYYVAPSTYDTYKHQLVPLCAQFADQYQAITIIGAKMQIKITNRCMKKSNFNTSGAEAPFNAIPTSTSLFPTKIWYAYRVDAYSEDDVAFPDWNLDEHGMKTYSNLKETGKFRMGIINSSTNNARTSTTTLNINYSAKKFWPGPMGLPDGPLAQEFEDVSTGTTTVKLPKPVKYKCIVRLVFGPSANYVKNIMENATGNDAPAMIVDLANATMMNNIHVDVMTQYHASLTQLQPIAGLDASGVIIPNPPHIKWAYEARAANASAATA